MVFEEAHINEEYLDMLNGNGIDFSRHRLEVWDRDKALEYVRERRDEGSILMRYVDESGKFLGTTCAMRKGGTSVDLGIMIRSDIRGRGIGLAIWRLALIELRDRMMTRVTAGTSLRNSRMLAILAKTMNFRCLYESGGDLCASYKVDFWINV